jgi:hypothetical protein
MGFIGGSAPAMANQIVEGYILPGANNLKNLSSGELNLLRAELDKMLREVRGVIVQQDDAQAQQARNRKIARLSSAVQVVTHQMTSK